MKAISKPKEKPGFYIWFNTVDSMAELNFEEKGMIYTAAEDYSRYGVIPSFENRFLRSVWSRLQHDLDADDARYRENQKKNQIKGWISDFKRNYAPAHGIDPNDKTALKEYIQQRLTMVDCCPQVSTNSSSSSNSSSNNKGKRDNEDREKGLTFTSQPPCSEREELEFEEKRMDAIRLLEGWGGTQDGL